ncbi:MAG: hypothetical protein M1826_002506 [Phylliscum demangeonii]|nr:MAG: hypothetical protein M1826_002506 [Phylliscum demangeonii]
MARPLRDDVRDAAIAAEEVASRHIGELFGVIAVLRVLRNNHDHNHNHNHNGRGPSRLPARLAAALAFCLHHLRQFERLDITPDVRQPMAYACVWREIQLLLRDGSPLVASPNPGSHLSRAKKA